jgi:transposase
VGKRARMHLTEDERSRVQEFLREGKANIRNLKRAEVLLKSDEGWNDDRIAQALDISGQTVRNIRKRFRTGGVEAVLADKRPQRPRRRRGLLSDEQITELMALAESEAPEGHAHWSVRLLAAKAVELGYAEHLSRETVRLLLKTRCERNADNTISNAL